LTACSEGQVCSSSYGPAGVAQQRDFKRRDGLPPTAFTANKVIAAWFGRLIPGGRDTADRLFAGQRTGLVPAVAL